MYINFNNLQPLQNPCLTETLNKVLLQIFQRLSLKDRIILLCRMKLIHSLIYNLGNYNIFEGRVGISNVP
eukprot:UN11269